MNKNLPTLINQAIFTALLGLCQSSLGMEQELKPERPEAVIDCRGTTVHEQMQIFRDAAAVAAAAPTGAAAAGAGATVAVRDISNSPAYNVVAEGTAAQILRGPVGWIALGSNSEVARLASLLRQNQK